MYCIFMIWVKLFAVKESISRSNAGFLKFATQKQAAKVLSTDMRLNLALPCRISVFTEKGATKIGLIKPAQMLAALSDNEQLTEVASDVENKTMMMVDEAK